MESVIFPYDAKWEQTQFQEPAKRIIEFSDVIEYQQRPIHQEYLDFLTDLQKVQVRLLRPFSPKRFQIPKNPPSLLSLYPGFNNCNNSLSKLLPFSSQCVMVIGPSKIGSKKLTPLPQLFWIKLYLKRSKELNQNSIDISLNHGDPMSG